MENTKKNIPGACLPRATAPATAPATSAAAVLVVVDDGGCL